MTPLHWACDFNHYACARLLIMYGADTFISDKFDRTPMTIAKSHNNQKIIELIEQSTELTICQNESIDDGNILSLPRLDDHTIATSECLFTQRKKPIIITNGKINSTPAGSC
ncbi:unnamed protein product [Didymodactylos carnosus]|uniref:Uncharacterized protein n=1 Tax=Didymodactylos carnosus TaxID=1234261 RepID=A0A815WTZ5_9BILA|nr:unnamed protein product [Didymodactylos carnosus]CAF1553651.1 unnamed protein product [Didymodactylos carnosus]CAF4019152.1 unnamed protein product [Didymodactylos carnosus]CAF4414762.1 unnamed protein product [Didymodactylos carnosus]